jgi:hypothetical protein
VPGDFRHRGKQPRLIPRILENQRLLGMCGSKRKRNGEPET